MELYKTNPLRKLFKKIANKRIRTRFDIKIKWK
jgi:hypothetical protein